MIEFRQGSHKIARAASLQGCMFFKSQIKTHSWIAHRVTPHQLQNVICFSASAAHKFETSGHVIKKLAYSDGRPMHTRSPPALRHLTSTERNECSGSLLAQAFGLNRPTQ